MIGTGCSSFLAAADSQQPSRFVHHTRQPALRSFSEGGTSPLKTRVWSFRQPPSGRFSRCCRRNRRTATGSTRCAYEIASGRRQWPNRDPLGEPGFEKVRGAKPRVLGDGPNLYTFVHNSPVVATDAYGLFLWGLFTCTEMGRCLDKARRDFNACNNAIKLNCGALSDPFAQWACEDWNQRRGIECATEYAKSAAACRGGMVPGLPFEPPG